MINDQYTTEDATQELLRISKWPEPLRLAYLLEKEMLWPLHGRAADELRRLHAIETKLAEQPAPVQPVAWVTVEDGKWISTRSADFRHIADGQYQLYVGPLAYEVPAAIKTLEALGYIYEEGEQWTAPPAAQPAPVQEPVATCKQHLQVEQLLNDMLDTLPYNSPEYWIGRIKEVLPLYTTPPAQPEPAPGYCKHCKQYSIEEPLTAAQPVVPDAMTSADIQEHIEYVAGWNECRQAMLEMMK